MHIKVDWVTACAAVFEVILIAIAGIKGNVNVVAAVWAADPL